MRSVSTSSEPTACRDRVRRSARERERSGQRLPLGVPRAGCALVLLVERRREDGRVTRDETSAGPGEDRLDRVALVGQRGRSASDLFARLVHLGLGEEHDVDARSSPARPTWSRALRPARRSGPGSYATAPRARPGGGRRRATAGPPALAPRSRRVCPQLHRAARPGARSAPEPGGCLASSTATSQPAAFNPNVVGTACCSRVRAAIGVDRWAPPARQGSRTRVELGENQVERAPRDEHRRGVHDVLARRAPVDVAGCVAAHVLSQRAYERLRGASDRAPTSSSSSKSYSSAAHFSAIAARGLGGTIPRLRLRTGERGLELEHRLEPRAPGDGVEQLLRDEERPERRHTAKNVVCRSP